MERHLKRQELIQAARHGGADFADHLDRCTDCADAVALLQRYSVAGRIRLPDAPVGWIENAVRLAHETSVLGRATSLVARLVFDSWLMPQPVGVRGEGLSNDRRVRFENDLVTFDLRAERERKNWSFVAHISGRKTPFKSITLMADRRELRADSSGLYQWTASRPPKKISLHSEELTVELPELTWKRRRSK